MDSYMTLRNGKKIYQEAAVKTRVQKFPTAKQEIPQFRLFNSWMEAAVVTLWILIVSGIFLMNIDVPTYDIFDTYSYNLIEILPRNILETCLHKVFKIYDAILNYI